MSRSLAQWSAVLTGACSAALWTCPQVSPESPPPADKPLGLPRASGGAGLPLLPEGLCLQPGPSSHSPTLVPWAAIYFSPALLPVAAVPFPSPSSFLPGCELTSWRCGVLTVLPSCWTVFRTPGPHEAPSRFSTHVPGSGKLSDSAEGPVFWFKEITWKWVFFVPSVSGLNDELDAKWRCWLSYWLFLSSSLIIQQLPGLPVSLTALSGRVHC